VKTYNLLHYGQLTHRLYDKLIFNKIKNALGFQHIRGMISGAAPLSDTVMIFFRILLSVPILEGTLFVDDSTSAIMCTFTIPYIFHL
jgi:long-subunit acyl-CoA synthetase (AMP-forming)